MYHMEVNYNQGEDKSNMCKVWDNIIDTIHRLFILS